MKLPFTQEQFLEVFARYNSFVWPAPVLLGALALAAIFLAWRPCRHSNRITSGICFLVIPLVWAVVGTTAAVTLGMHEDAAMGLAAVFAVLKLTVSRRRSAAIPRGDGVEPALGEHSNE